MARKRVKGNCTGVGFAPMMHGIPHMRGRISIGYDDRRADSLEFDGPLDDTMRKIIRKYNIPKERLFALVVPVLFGWYGIAAILAGVRLAHGVY